MKHRLLATAAALALSVAVCPAYAQTSPNPQGGVSGGSSQGTGQGGGSLHKEQDQGIKTGQTGGSPGATQGTSSGSSRPAAETSGSGSAGAEKGEKAEKSEKNATPSSGQTKQGTGERDQNRSTAKEHDQKNEKSAKEKERERDKSTASERERSKATTESKDQGGKDQSKMSKESGGRAKAVSLDKTKQTRVSVAIRGAHVQREAHVNFSVRVGVRVPTTVHFYPLPVEVVEIVPEYRGYLYFIAEDEIVIVDPETHEIVTIIPYSSASIGLHKQLSSNDRQTIRMSIA